MNIRWPVVVVVCLLGISVLATQITVGDAVPSIAAADQHGIPFVLTNGTQYLLVVTEMACAKAANQKLAAQGAGFLEKHQAFYLMDIHTMPSIARVFAFPKLRKYPQRIVLVDSADALASFPSQAGRVTVLALTPSGHIQKITYWNPDSEALAAYLK